jgi:5'-methylthioadenosine phosphorylase
MPELGIIGGSGLYSIPGLADVRTHEIETPFGAPSSPVISGRLGEVEVAFVARHGVGHTLLPSEVPYRANIAALKMLGVRRVLSVSAVGSLQEKFAPLDVALPDQIFDRTKGRASTLFGDGLVAHVDFARPFCSSFGDIVESASRSSGANVHRGGVLVVIEGPQFSTRAESEAYRRQGFGLVGMTAIPEAKLAREAELCYATLAMVTDYDVWHPSHESVTSEMVASNVHKNSQLAHAIIAAVAQSIAYARECACHDALGHAFVTRWEDVPKETLTRLQPIIGRYLSRSRTTE